MSLLDEVNRDFEQILNRTDPAAQMQTLADRMKEKGMHMHGEPFPTFLKPYFVEHADRPLFAHATMMMIASLNKIGAAYFANGGFAKQIQLTGRTADLAAVDAGYPGHQIFNRLDVFFIPETKELKFLEFNCGDPSGMGWHDQMLEMFLDLPVIREMGKKYNFHVDWLVKSHHIKFIGKYKQWCARKGIVPEAKPNVAFVCWRESTVRGDFLAFVDYYNKMGYPTVIADPSDFEYDGQKLTLDGQHIPLLYRDAIDDMIKDEFWDGCQKLIQAYRDGNVCFVNPVSAASGDFKSILEILSDPSFESLFTPAEREAHAQFIPWTRTFVEGKTAYKGKEIDLVTYVRKHKDEFVLKPNDGYGGFGILVGPAAAQDAWEKLIDTSFAEGKIYTVQELVNIPKAYFPVVESGEMKGFSTKNVNINFWSHDGEFAGSFVRAAAGSVINVHQGGGMVPTFPVSLK